MIFTSYYANWRHFPASAEPVSISRHQPPGFGGRCYLDLAPTPEVLYAKKAGQITEAEYTEAYRRQLSLLDPGKVAQDLDGKVILCYEKTGDFCHRHLVADWLRSHGYFCEEVQKIPK